MRTQLTPKQVALADREADLASQLTAWVSESGISEDRIPVVNMYVALKSKPLLVLAGPPESGKQALAQCVAQFLSGGSCEQCQVITGHPWWADHRENLTFLTGLHTRFLVEKLTAILEEAALQKNRDHVFTACLMHVSPAEVLSFFREVASQICDGQIKRLGDARLPAPIPYPSNLFLIGTIDTLRFNWWDDEFLAKATVIHWTGGQSGSPFPDGFRFEASEFLQFRICSRQAAYHKLHALVGNQKPIRIIFQIESLLRQYDISLSFSMLDEVVIFLANSWTANGQGLFDQSLKANLAIALDLAIAQIVFPHIDDQLDKTTDLVSQLHALLGQDYPYSIASLEAQSDFALKGGE